MVMVMKLTGFCWNIQDGRLSDKDLTDAQKEKAIKELPSLLNYAGYVLFFPSLMAGPAFDYVEYKRWIETTMFELPAGVDPSKRAPTKKKRKIPRSGTPAAWKAATGLLWILVFLKASSWYYPEMLTDDTFMTHGFLKRVWLLHMVGFTTRTKYYGVWYLTEGACILSGLGYNGVNPITGKVSWDRLRNVNPWGVESAQNTRAYLGNWNINTNNWLRNYMYLRVTPRGKKPGFRASMATFVTSAFWHGFYPGYYLAFVLASFVQTIARSKTLLNMFCCHLLCLMVFSDFRRYVRPFVLDPATQTPNSYKIYYDIFSYLATQAGFSFVVAPFYLLTLPASLLVWGRVYFYAVVGTTTTTAFFYSPAKNYLVKTLKARTGAELKRTHSQESLTGKEPLMGIPPDIGELDEAVREVRMEIEERKKRGVHRSETMPNTPAKPM